MIRAKQATTRSRRKEKKSLVNPSVLEEKDERGAGVGGQKKEALSKDHSHA